MRLITIEDIRDVYLKLLQRGISFLLSKLSLNQVKRTQSSFNCDDLVSINWWIIPEVRMRWNELITGSKDKTYEEFVSQSYFKEYDSLQMLSIGSGVSSHELRLAELNAHWEITCVDFSDSLLAAAQRMADGKNLKNIRFLNKNILEYDFPENSFDVVFFHQSLHHFKEMDEFMKKKVINQLKASGYLIINEYVGVNRLQFHKNQINAVNKCLGAVPKTHKQLYRTSLIKNKYYGSGLLRMIISDPSECVESENIMPVINKYFETLFEKGFGGNLLMPVFKDISHHFVNAAHEQDTQLILKRLFELEDQFLLNHPSDYVFGIYKKKYPSEKTA